jgi:hypothetical protein
MNHAVLIIVGLVFWLPFEFGIHYAISEHVLSKENDLKARIARNHKFWEEYDRVRGDPHLMANPEKWPECLQKDYLNDPVYKTRVQELIESSRQFEDQSNDRHS